MATSRDVGVSSPGLPEPFRDLEPFLGWALARENEAPDGTSSENGESEPVPMIEVLARNPQPELMPER